MVGRTKSGGLAYRTPNDKGPGWGYCPDCGELTVVGEMMGAPYRLSRHSVPYRDALVLARYGLGLYHIFQSPGLKRLVAADWLPPRKPREGRLYARHDCLAWR